MTPEQAHAQANQEFADQIAGRAREIQSGYIAQQRDMIDAKQRELEQLRSEVAAFEAAQNPSEEQPQG